jgi:hypothetical protein
MPILRLQPNTPTTISLRFLKPREKPNRSGHMEYEYVTSNGDILYLPPVAKESIDSLHIGTCESFTLTKKVAAGNAVVWDIERAPGRAGESQSQSGNGAGGLKLPRRPMAKSSTLVHPMHDSELLHAGNHTTPELTTEESRRLFRQLVAAIEAAAAAEKHSERIDYSVKFTSEDIRALAISAFIQQSRSVAA